jgi:transcription termination factor NusB
MFRAISSFALASSRIFSSDTPAAVVIDEALELARR